jgi:hypothetical protein
MMNVSAFQTDSLSNDPAGDCGRHHDNFHPSWPNSLNGIISYLAMKCGGNVVCVTSSRNVCGKQCRRFSPLVAVQFGGWTKCVDL